MADASKPAPSFKELFENVGKLKPSDPKVVRSYTLTEFDDGTWDIHETDKRRPLGRQNQGFVELPSIEAALAAVDLLQPPSAAEPGTEWFIERATYWRARAEELVQKQNPRDEILALIDGLTCNDVGAWGFGYRMAIFDVIQAVKKRWPS